MNRCSRRLEQRRTERLLGNPVVQKLIDDTASDVIADFVVNAFENRPPEVPKEKWEKLVTVVLVAGQGGPEALAEKVDKTPETDA
jgi:hypothetical protein